MKTTATTEGKPLGVGSLIGRAISAPTPAPDAASPPIFATTHWSVVLAAANHDTPEAAAALEQLCRIYWYPLYAYIRRQG